MEGLLNYECCKQCGITLQAAEIEGHQCVQCMVNPPYFDETLCLDRYNGILQDALHQLKYQRRIAFAHGIAYAWNFLLEEQSANQDAHYLFPVPLSLQKLAARGFNQSWELAKRIACGAHIQKLPYALKRHHHAKQQVGGSATIRHLSIKNKFYIDPNYVETLKNKTVIVFDDVMTSGATLNEIARILKDNGVSRVINWVLLRTPRPS